MRLRRAVMYIISMLAFIRLQTKVSTYTPQAVTLLTSMGDGLRRLDTVHSENVHKSISQRKNSPGT